MSSVEERGMAPRKTAGPPCLRLIREPSRPPRVSKDLQQREQLPGKQPPSGGGKLLISGSRDGKTTRREGGTLKRSRNEKVGRVRQSPRLFHLRDPGPARPSAATPQQGEDSTYSLTFSRRGTRGCGERDGACQGSVGLRDRHPEREPEFSPPCRPSVWPWKEGEQATCLPVFTSFPPRVAALFLLGLSGRTEPGQGLSQGP